MPTAWRWGATVLGFILVAVAAGAWAWQRQRRRVAEMQRRLAFAEQSRFELEAQVQAADVKLSLLSETLRAQRRALLTARDEVARRRADGQVPHTGLAAASDARASPNGSTWADTLPMDGDPPSVMGPRSDAYADTVGDIEVGPGRVPSDAEGSG
jgi:hypothetical protein